MPAEPDPITVHLERIRLGSAEARDELVALLYDRFRQRAHQRLRHERAGHTLGTTGLTNETLLRLLEGGEFARAADGNQLFGAFARRMRQVLVDHARRRKAEKRGGDRQREELDDLVEDVRGSSQMEVLSLNEALDAFAADYPRAAVVLEMQYFGGYTHEEIGAILGVSLSTVEKAARFGRGSLRVLLSPEEAT